MSDHDLFHAEESALLAAAAVHADEHADAGTCRAALGALIGQFRRFVRESRRLIMHSDRQERELTALNNRLQQLAAELDFKATHDTLTQALNRGAIIARAEALLQSDALALVVLDIDHFKRINDEYGHPVGDAVIAEMVARLREVAPPCAEIGRVGGEEFTVLLPCTSLGEALALAEKMRVHVAAVPFAKPAGRIVTASFGVSWNARGAGFDKAYAEADAALYAAKREGRNRVATV